MNRYKIGNFITSLRKEKEMTQEQLAEKLDVSGKAVSKWENGKCLPETTQLIKMSKLFDVTIDEILYGERVNNPNDIHKEVTQESYTMLRASERSLKSTLYLVSAMFILNGLLALILGLCVETVGLYVLSLLDILVLLFKNKKNKSPTINIKIAKIGLIITIILTIAILAYDIVMMFFLLPKEEVFQFEIVSGVKMLSWIAISLFYIYHISIVPAIMHFIMIRINSSYKQSSDNDSSMSCFDIALFILMILLLAPIFMVKYYVRTLKILNNKMH